MAKVFIRANVPDALLKAYMQHLRDFDAKHADCHFDILADCPEMPMREIVEAMRVDPKLDFNAYFTRVGKDR